MQISINHKWRAEHVTTTFDVTKIILLKTAMQNETYRKAHSDQ